MRPRDPDERDLDAVRSGEPGDPEDLALHRLGAVARSLTDEDHDLQDPPPDLWARVAANVAADVAPPRPGPGAVPAPGDAGTGEGGGTVVRPARWWRSRPLMAAAAAIVVVAGFVGALAVARDADDGDAEVVATVELEPLGDVPGGSGRLVEVDGRLMLDMQADVPAPADPGAFYEVWLIDESIEGMVSLGPVRPDGTYELPTNVDYADYPIVDVSVEPDDGDPSHSGSSILRGTLSA